MAGLLIAVPLFALSTGAHADVFGSGGGQTATLIERLTALEKELKDIKDRSGPMAPPSPGMAATGKAAGQVGLVMPPPPGLEGLPMGGADERERLLVEKELTYEVLGTVNGQIFVRDGNSHLVMSEKDFKAFERDKRQKVVRKMKVDAVSEGDASRVSFPQLQPPMPEVSEAAPPAAKTTPTSAQANKPAAPVNTAPGQARPASPVQKR